MNKRNIELNDVYHDQIMDNHPSRNWSPRLFSKFVRDLAGDGWMPIRRNSVNIDLHHATKDQTIFVHVMAPPPTINFNNTTLISDIVCRQPIAKKHLNLWPECFGEFWYEFQYINSKPSKQFNCLINRGCPMRQSWMYQLTRMKLLNQGHISYWCEDRFGGKSPSDYFEFLFKGNEIFAQEHEYLRNSIPYKNFSIPIEQAILDSEISIVIETYFDNNDFICLSEKIWRNIQLPRPWLLFASQHSVKFLRDLGLDVYDDYVDHSYDNEANSVARQLAILSQINHMQHLTTNDLLDLEQRAFSNRKKLHNWLTKWPEKYQKILNQITSISNCD